MTKNYWKENWMKFLWIVVPSFIGLMTWVIVTLFTIDGEVKVMNAQATYREQLQQKIYNKIENIDQHKLDKEVYTVRHEEIIKDINEVKQKVDKIYLRQSKYFTHIDTEVDMMSAFFLKSPNEFVRNKMKKDTIYPLLTDNKMVKVREMLKINK